MVCEKIISSVTVLGGCKTLWQVCQRSVLKYTNNTLLGGRKFVLDADKKTTFGPDRIEVDVIASAFLLHQLSGSWCIQLHELQGG